MLTTTKTSKVACIFGLLSLLGICKSQTIVGKPCSINGRRNLQGTCQLIKNCPAVIANIRSGVPVTLCDSNNRNVSCCPNPTEKRISAKKCEQYTEILKIRDGPTPLLPPSFLDEKIDHEVHCNPNLNKLIVGGGEAKPDEFPHAVAVGYDVSDYPWRCGGTLISEEYVLTAAHCIDSTVGRPTKLLLGDIILSTKTGPASPARIQVGISNIIKHPNYRVPLTYNDIALIKMDTKVKISRHILPACLPNPEDDLLKPPIKNRTFQAVGWGFLGPGESQSENLQVVALKGFTQKSCFKFYKDAADKEVRFPEGLKRSQLCAGDSMAEKDTCQGDSGGPLTINKDKRCVFYISGITSFGPRLCGMRVPAVYTNVYSYLEWIEDNVWPDEQ